MSGHKVFFENTSQEVTVPTGTLITEAAQRAGVDILMPCGGQGRCGRCVVQVKEGEVRRRSTLNLSPEDLEQNFALACQTVVEGDVIISIPSQEKIQRRLTSDLMASEVSVPEGYDHQTVQDIRRFRLTLTPPSMDDQTDDWNRLQRELRQVAGIDSLNVSLPILQQIPALLRDNGWKVTAIISMNSWDCAACPPSLISVLPGHVEDKEPLWAISVDIGTTTVSLWLVDLITGKVHIQTAEYNGQISRGEDVISRIVYAGKGEGSNEMSRLVVETINQLLEQACQKANILSSEIVKAVIAGNSTMIHLLLNIPAGSIRLEPFVTVINHVPIIHAREIGILIHPEAPVDCLPGVASYVGADITAGVLSSGVDDTSKITLFMDVGTNGEIVLGSRDWLVTCACSAGPAFEGAGVRDGMRATEGAIEEIWINRENYEPTLRVIGGVKPKGLCGSGLITILGELFLSGIVDKAGNINMSLNTTRVREGDHGGEYVVAWSGDTIHGQDIVITHVDIDNLLRAKAAIYAGYSILARSVGLSLDVVEQVLIGGSFGKYINVEKAIEIGLLPDMPWELFEFLGNTSVRGAYLALLDNRQREKIKDIALRMTYIELSADNAFYEEFMSALFLPHTDMSLFPNIAQKIEAQQNK